MESEIGIVEGEDKRKDGRVRSKGGFGCGVRTIEGEDERKDGRARSKGGA